MKKQPSSNKGRCKINGFKYPAADTISGRTSTICRSMACTLVTREPCTPELEKTWLSFFNDKCAYCGDKATHLDHLFLLLMTSNPLDMGRDHQIWSHVVVSVTNPRETCSGKILWAVPNASM